MKRKISLAIADDHKLFREGFVNLLNKQQFNVLVQAENGRQLIDKVSDQKVLPDVFIIDINMPVLNGYETLVAIKKKWKNARVIAITMFDSEIAIINMIKYGINGYLLKSFSFDEIEEAIGIVHTEGFYIPRSISNKIIPILTNRVDSDADIHKNFSALEIDFLKACCYDLTYKEIATQLKVSGRVVESLRDSLFNKLCVKSRVGLVVKVLKSGFVEV